ncbi:hypothetical protein [Rhizobium tumorigenes]|uniref:Uncharacterized protein n=1 Tax=Rhizobium tumorigenes TaxID=2041385 RepID=A0AAF1KN55_9HYPH|nr:hypothetical protein [Rhizobium tumorigenes]WFR98253.1 hypothetical protein PR017_23160 [Rhizobium tumorigenes]WFS03765.1 hypothetical protein PR016_23590 [Rhizobium tumorigenes]
MGLDHFPDFTEAELAKIDALIESHSNSSLSERNLRGAAIDNVFREDGVVERADNMPINSARPTGLDGERSTKTHKSSQASLEDFPDLTDADLAHIEELERITRTAVEKGKRKISPKSGTRSGFGNSSAPEFIRRSFTEMVPNGDQPIPSCLYEAQKVRDKVVENTYVAAAVDPSGARNDVENVATKPGAPAPALRDDNLRITLALTRVGDVASGAGAGPRLTTHGAEHLAIDDNWQQNDRDRRRLPYTRGLDSPSREGYGR